MPAPHPDRPFASVWFDCDSTLSAIEGIDELAARRDSRVRDEIAELTNQAMDGSIPLEHVYKQRLERIAPTWAECGAVGVKYAERMVPDADRVCAALHWLGKTVGILSGGLRPCVEALARNLEIPPRLAIAVPVRFDPDGGFASFDEESPLARSDGKPEILARRPDEERPLVMVGDGVTDLATRGTVDRFVGFGGVVERIAVREAAEFYTAGPGLRSVLPFVLTEAECEQLRGEAQFRDLLD